MRITSVVLLIFFLVLSCETEELAVNYEPTGESPETALSEESSSAGTGDSSFENSIYGKNTAIILEGASSHRVRWGDTLSKLAARYYGKENGYYFPLIMIASRGVVSDPDRIISGRIVTIPDLRRNLDNPDSRQMLKEYINEVANSYDARPPTKWSVLIQNQLRALASTL